MELDDRGLPKSTLPPDIQELLRGQAQPGDAVTVSTTARVGHIVINRHQDEYVIPEGVEGDA